MLTRFRSALTPNWESIQMRLLRVGFGIVFVVPFASQSGGWFPLPFIERLDGILYEVRLRLTESGGVDSHVVIIDIAEQSMSELETASPAAGLVRKITQSPYSMA